MKKKNIIFIMAACAAASGSCAVQAELGIDKIETKEETYAVYARDYSYGTDEVYKEDLIVDMNLDSIISLDSKDPCLVFYRDDDSYTPELCFSKGGTVTISSYYEGFLNETPENAGKICAVYYLKPVEEAGMEFSLELYDQNYDTAVKIEEKSGKTCFVALSLESKNGESQRTDLVFLKDGIADQELWWFLGKENTKAEILGIIPIEEMTEGDYETTVSDWILTGEEISEWSSYASTAVIDLKDAKTGLIAYGCENLDKAAYSGIDNETWVTYGINQMLPQEVQDMIGAEDNEVVYQKASESLPEEKPDVKVYGFAAPDEIVDIPVSFKGNVTFEDVLKSAEYVQISMKDGSSFSSYKEYQKYIKGETETETGTEAIAETEISTEVITETDSETEKITEAGTETEAVYTDEDTVKKVQTVLNEKGFDCGTVDGKFGKKTLAALHEYQKSEKLEETDQITDTVLKAMEIEK